MTMPLQMRKRWGCPDLGHAAEFPQPVPGSKEQFPDCPAAYLRSGHDIERLHEVGVGDPMNEHLIDGCTHPASLVGEYVFELKSGSRNVSELSQKARALCHLWMSEENSRDEYRAEQRRENHG